MTRYAFAYANAPGLIFDDCINFVYNETQTSRIRYASFVGIKNAIRIALCYRITAYIVHAWLKVF